MESRESKCNDTREGAEGEEQYEVDDETGIGVYTRSVTPDTEEEDVYTAPEGGYNDL